ncbi:MAG: LmeA family phospholipid-binding protein [Mycobacterium sp.]|nr:LmeA family phospholipid-binding protein [Mycobacterium sp.]
MSNPRGPSSGDPVEGPRSPRPAGPPNRGVPPRRQAPPPSEYPTRQVPYRGRPQDQPRDVPRPQQPMIPPNRPPQQPGLPPNPRPHQHGPAPHPYEQPTTRIATPPPSQDTPAAATKRGFFANRTALLLILLIVLLLIVAVPIGAELYTRHLASSKVANAVQCEAQDSASVSFAAAPPVLWQYLTSHYTDISVQTAGNQVRSAKGMTVNLDIRDVKLNNTNNSAGTIGSINGTITWSSDGIKQSIQDAVPVLGEFVTGEVTTNPGDGTVSLKGALDSATVKPQIVNNGLSLQVVSLTALGSKMSTTTVQKNLDDLTSKATQNLPLGIHADSVKVTSNGVEGSFSSSNATIPAGGSQDPCFANL